ncbi:MAG: TonB-dependent receptor, partial [Pseudomonadota bacterium]
MVKSTKAPAAFKKLLVRSVAAASLLSAYQGVAVAQETDEESVQSTIVITGSRIARDPNLGSPVPVQSVTGADLLNSGNFNITETINDVPALLNSLTSEQSIDTADNDGTNVLDLRGLGTDRTLVLVNGRRHVSGLEGSAAVDIGSIPSALVERVEVLTGGASAVYGADAVSGVVNFILRDDFEGFEADFTKGLSGEGDAGQTRAYALWGKNFANGKGNITFNVEYFDDDGLTLGDRDFTRGGAQGDDDTNPDLRFQQGDISAAETPNFFEVYDFATSNTGIDLTGTGGLGNFGFGLSIPDGQAGFEEQYRRTYELLTEQRDMNGDVVLDDDGDPVFVGTGLDARTGAAISIPTLNAAELALVERAANAPSRAVLRQRTFSITSGGGTIAPGDFSLAPGVDLDGNGTDDCLDSFTGYNSVTKAGGCWVAGENGAISPVQDVLVAGNFNGFGGSGVLPTDESTLIGKEDKLAFNVNANYEFSPEFEVFGEAKYVRQNVRDRSTTNAFWDLVYISPDNAYIPEELQAVADDTGGLYITRDSQDLGFNEDKTERTTQRYLAGVKGEFNETWSYEISANYGEFELRVSDNNRIQLDRQFAALDAVVDPDGNIVCRSDLGGTDYATSLTAIPSWDGGFFTFTPGDGQCQPFNPFGLDTASQEAVDFITTTTENTEKITQTVLSGVVTGDSANWFELPGGPIGFAAGLEFREETSSATFDPLIRGVIPVDGFDIDGNPVAAGTALNTVADQNSLVFDPDQQVSNADGEYDTFDYFAEVSAPLLSEAPFAHSLVLDGAVRVADYSTIGQAETWKVGGTWSPVEDITFRVTQSEAIRAPNIFELFSPDQGVTFRPTDPCDAAEIPNAPDPALRQANCVADGLPVGFTDPLSARFFGVEGGNANLEEETAETITIGVVFQPRFLDGFSLSVDYWDIEIEDAIVAVDDQDIVDNCYDSVSLNNAFCPLFTRVTDPNSPQFGGFNFLRQTQQNFAALEASGVDFDARYAFDVGENSFALSVAGTYQEKLDQFFDPADPTAIDPELGEIQRPEWSGVARVSYDRGPLALSWSTRYQSEQTVTGVEIESVDTFVNGLEDEIFIHDFFGSWSFDNGLTLRG